MGETAAKMPGSRHRNKERGENWRGREGWRGNGGKGGQ